MANLFPQTPKAIQARIRSYERKLKAELNEEYPGNDGYGKRYLLGILYMLMGDTPGALASFDWYEKNFPGDGGDAHQYLTWTLTLYRSDLKLEAFNKLYQTMFYNMHLVPHLLGKLEFPEDLEYSYDNYDLIVVKEFPDEALSLWSNEEKQWVEEVINSPEFSKNIDEYIKLEKELESVEPGPERIALLEQVYKLRDHRFSFL
ncbi:MAG: hypothetical protein ACKVH8_25210 [Pirellulales bacterium]|jgi:hypothetical protein